MSQDDQRSDVFVQFGASGDLAKKMTFVSLYHLVAGGQFDIPIVGVAFDDWDDDTLRKHARADVEATGEKIDESVWSAFAQQLHYVQGDYTKPETYQRVKDAIGDAERPLFYLEIPPGLFETAVKGLYEAGLTNNARVVIEKPFGTDLESAKALNTALHKMVNEDQIYRVDHYLGKNAVEDIMVWRFANGMIESLWDREHIACVMITMAESFDVADRGSFYDSVGALKDVVQNHLMQVTGLLAMEPPTRNASNEIHSEQTKVFDAIDPIDPSTYVRGQYNGYLDVKGVAPGSTTETFVALRVDIDSWRWANVPFFIRAGKSLAMTATEVVVKFRRPPLTLFQQEGVGAPEPNLMRLQLGPTDGVVLRMQAKDPAGGMQSRPVVLDANFEQELGKARLPYELLLGSAVDGDSTLFATQEMVIGTWTAVDPLLEHPGPVHKYEPGTMGPAEADALVADFGGWVDPLGSADDQPG